MISFVSKKWIAFAALMGVLGTAPLFLYALAMNSVLFASLRLAPEAVTSLPMRVSPASEQWIAVIAGFLIKPIYMLIAFAIIVAVWRQRARDVATLRWSMIFFFVGEVFCWVNILFFDEQSLALEYLHSVGMVACLAFLAFAVSEGIDRRVAHFSDRDAKCALLGLCRGCAKYKPVACALHRLFALSLVSLIILSVMPLNADLLSVGYSTRIFGVFHIYSHPLVNQLYEIRYSPIAAIILLATAFVAWWRSKDAGLLIPQVFFAAGCGFLGFAFLRLALVAFYRDNLVWFAFWEETTELLLVSCVGIILWIFRAELVLRSILRDPIREQ